MNAWDDYIEITIKGGGRKFTRAIAYGDINKMKQPEEYILNEAKVMIRDFAETDSTLKAAASGGEAL